MTPFEQYLISIGYTRNRLVGSKKHGYRFIEDNGTYHFSTMENGGNSYFYIKGKSIIEFGLHEYQKPPTLISPRPKNCLMDDNMNRMLQEQTPEHIYNLLTL